MSGEVGSNNSDIFPTLHEVSFTANQIRELRTSTKPWSILKVADSRVWLVTLEGMAGDIGIALRSQEGTRAATKWWLDQIAEATKLIMACMDREEVHAALSVFAPLSPRDIDDGTGFEYMSKLHSRAERASAAIRVGKGRDSLQDNLGFPSPHLLCAACISEAMFAISGRRPGPANEGALVACHALWLAAGGADTSTVGDLGGLWERHLRDARSKETSAARLARRTARSHVAAAQQN